MFELMDAYSQSAVIKVVGVGGGGGNAVKHGDLDSSLFYPSEDVDVHMGRYDFQCVDCHRTEDHQIGGHMISVSVTAENAIACTDCHETNLHSDERITAAGTSGRQPAATTGQSGHHTVTIRIGSPLDRSRFITLRAGGRSHR